MGLKETVQSMRRHLSDICRDLDKSQRGNRSASQRVRTGTIELAKIAKIYRKESVAAEKKEEREAKKRKKDTSFSKN